MLLHSYTAVCLLIILKFAYHSKGEPSSESPQEVRSEIVEYHNNYSAVTVNVTWQPPTTIPGMTFIATRFQFKQRGMHQV